MIDDADWARVARFLADECTPDEAETIRGWIDADPERRRAVATLRDAWQRAARPPRGWDSDAAWRRLSARAQGREVIAPPSARPSGTHPAQRARGAGLVAIGGAVIAGMLALTALRHGGWTFGRGAPPHDSMRERVYHTAAGQRAVVALLDGTRVELGVESTLRVNGWTSASRVVALDGEAAFTVAHDDRRPFVVHARNAVVNDLGTRFNVRAYRGDRQVRVAVAEGQVAFSDSARVTTPAILHGGDAAVLDLAGRLAIEHDADTASFLAWTHDRFAVRDMPLADVAAQLERQFDVRVVLPDSTAGAARVTTDVPAQRLTDILDAATGPLGLAYSQAGRTVTVRRRTAR